MIKPLFYTCLLLFHLIADAGYAQEKPDTVVPVMSEEDSIEARLDSLSGFRDDSDDEENNMDSLFFSGKTNPSSFYDSSEIKNRAVPDSVTEQLKTDDAFWYANKDLQVKKKESEDISPGDKVLLTILKLLSSPTFRQMMWWTILLLFATAIVWFLAKNKMNIFGSGRSVTLVPPMQDGVINDIFTIDLRQLMHDAEATADYRLAIRFAYLQLLKTFSEKGLIGYSPDSTNSEYLTQLFQNPCYQDFFKVTRSYEYAWYGEMPVTKQQYQNIKNDFGLLYQKNDISI
ncbi:MAG TPA: DUF4129 domain-containing protein [Agriterribacter sp.]|nr:DUF4129 domain-containing protein [Agriterribacter sp.]